MTQREELINQWTPLSSKKLEDLDIHEYQKIRGLVLKLFNLAETQENVINSINSITETFLKDVEI